MFGKHRFKSTAVLVKEVEDETFISLNDVSLLKVNDSLFVPKKTKVFTSKNFIILRKCLLFLPKRTEFDTGK